jgi:hypothetical protein
VRRWCPSGAVGVGGAVTSCSAFSFKLLTFKKKIGLKSESEKKRDSINRINSYLKR